MANVIASTKLTNDSSLFIVSEQYDGLQPDICEHSNLLFVSQHETIRSHGPGGPCVDYDLTKQCIGRRRSWKQHNLQKHNSSCAHK